MNNEPMTCADLMQKISGRSFDKPEEAVAVVRLSEHAAGPVPAAHVVDAFYGFDWDSGRFIIYTDKELVSWEYLERYVPDIREQVERAISERNKRALKRIMGRDYGTDQ